MQEMIQKNVFLKATCNKKRSRHKNNLKLHVCVKRLTGRKSSKINFGNFSLTQGKQLIQSKKK